MAHSRHDFVAEQLHTIGLPIVPKTLRVVLTYVLPSLAILYVVLAGLWLVPDSFAGMYGNHDGQWASWITRAILQWSGFLDFSPSRRSPAPALRSLLFSALAGPECAALTIPGPLPVRHLVSMLVYLAEPSITLYLLYRHLEFSRAQSFLAVILYVCIFFVPFWRVTQALPWHSLAPMNAHSIASVNVATIALIRIGDERFGFKLLYGFSFSPPCSSPSLRARELDDLYSGLRGAVDRNSDPA